MAPSPPQTRPVTITAHRGASAAAPENTMAAFLRALEAGVAAIETDIRLSKDGIPVLFHDQSLERLTGTAVQVADLHSTDLAAIDVGSWMSPGFADEGVPTLAWLAERCRDQTELVLDLKVDGAAAAIADSLRGAGFAIERARLCAWSAAQADEVRRHLPEARLVFIENPLKPHPCDWLVTLAQQDYHGLSLPYPSIDGPLVDAAHQAGLQVFTFTVNDAAETDRVRAAGVDGIITDGSPSGVFPQP